MRALALGVTFIFTFEGQNQVKAIFVLLLLFGAGIDLYCFLPYSVLWPKESRQTTPKNKSHSLSLIHSPIFIEFNLTPLLKSEQEAPNKEPEDEKEAQETLQKVKK